MHSIAYNRLYILVLTKGRSMKRLTFNYFIICSPYILAKVSWSMKIVTYLLSPYLKQIQHLCQADQHAPCIFCSKMDLAFLDKI